LPRQLTASQLLQLFLILIATPLFSATIYKTLSRLSRSLTAGKRRMRWTSALYIILDIACLVLQVIGTVMEAYGSGSDKKNSSKYVACGLILQLLAFLLFMLLAWRLQRRVSADPTFVSAHPRAPRWRRRFAMLYVASMLVLVRNLVRVVEFVQGGDGEILQHETYLYVFDARPMFLLVVVVAVLHPGRVVRFARKLEKETGSVAEGTTAETSGRNLLAEEFKSEDGEAREMGCVGHT